MIFLARHSPTLRIEPPDHFGNNVKQYYRVYLYELTLPAVKYAVRKIVSADGGRYIDLIGFLRDAKLS
jgi:hypothetical protein